MARMLKAGGVWLAIMAVVWLAALWRWQSTGHQASDGEIVTRLFVMPLLLAACVMFALWGVRRLRDHAGRSIAPAASLASAASATPSIPARAGAADAAARQASAWVLAEAVHLPVGDDPAQAWAALRSHAVRPAPDAGLVDVDGMPVMAARVLAPAWDDEEHGRWWADDIGDVPLPPHVRRGLALLAAPLGRLLQALQDRTPFAMPGLDAAAGGQAAAGLDGRLQAHLSGVAAPVSLAERRARAAGAPHLTVRVLWPAHWQPAECDAALACLRRQCGPVLDWARAAKARGVTWRAESLAQPECFWDELDEAIVQWSRLPHPELMLVLAVDSLLNAEGIDAMQSRGELFTALHQTGRMPGEGAAGLLLASTWDGAWEAGASVQAVDVAHAPVRMARPARARRDTSADALGRVGISALHATLADAVALCGASEARLVAVADADHRGSRTAELFESLQEALPGIDPMLSVVRMGEACGEIGMARALAPTALACAALREGGEGIAHALAVHLQSSHDRVVVALSSWQAASSAPSSAPSPATPLAAARA